jgi:hypothetical protein
VEEAYPFPPALPKVYPLIVDNALVFTVVPPVDVDVPDAGTLQVPPPPPEAPEPPVDEEHALL